jgi:WD40 repeat protein
LIISLSRDNTIRLWSQSTQKCIKIIDTHFSYIIYNNLFNFEGNKIILCDNNNINIILLETDDRIILSGHTDNIVDMVFNSDETLLLSVSHDNTVRIWSMKTYECIGVLNHKDIINNISVYGMREVDEKILKNILETITLPEISDIIINYTY